MHVRKRLHWINGANVGLRRRQWSSDLPIGLSVELISSNKETTGGVTRPEKHHIGRCSLVRIQNDEVADANIARGTLLQNTSLQVQLHVGCLVDLGVINVPCTVIVKLLQHGDGKDEDKWCDKGDEETDAKGRNDLRERNQ